MSAGLHFALEVCDARPGLEACRRSSMPSLMHASSLPLRSSPVKNPARRESADRARIYKARASEHIQAIHCWRVTASVNDFDSKAEVNRMTLRSRCSAPGAKPLTLVTRS
jgi:hypothetical protein